MPRPPEKSHKFADVLAEQIADGTLVHGAWLPAERTLAEEHGMTRKTVRTAIDLLAERGLVERVAGSGAKVVGAPAVAAADESDVKSELAAIHDVLRQITARLDAIEANTRSE